MVSADETGWKLAGQTTWLWTFATPEVTVYAILDGRGFQEAAGVLGAEYSGVLIRDGWAPYRRFEEAAHESCLAHLLWRAVKREDLVAVKRFKPAVRGAPDLGGGAGQVPEKQAYHPQPYGAPPVRQCGHGYSFLP